MNSAPTAVHSAPASHRSSRRAWLTSLLAAALAAAGGCSLSVEADVSDVAVTQHDIAIAGLPMAGRLGDVSTHFSFTETLPALNLPTGTQSNLRSAKVDFVAKKGVTDLSFVKALRVTMTANGSDAPLELLNYEKADGAVVGATLSVDSLNTIDLLAQWKDKAVFDIQVAGTLPEADWAVDLTVHFDGQVAYKY